MSYTGLCIGGPLDGQRVESSTSSIELQMVPQLSPSFQDQTQASINPTTVFYHYIEAGSFGLWVLEGWTAMDWRNHVVKALGDDGLATAYEKMRLEEKT